MKIQDVERGLLAILVVSVLYIAVSVHFLSGFKGLPSPLFGGDYYYQLGQIHHMYESDVLSWFGSSNGIGTLPGYLPVYGIIVTLFGKIALLDPIEAMFWANILFIPLSLILFYKMLRELFTEEVSVAVILVLFWVYTFPIFKYTEFTKLVMVPLFILMLIRFFKNREFKNALFLGVSFGLLALSHTTGLVYGAALFGAAILLMAYNESSNLSRIREYLLSNKPLLLAISIGALVSLVYWFTPLFTYHFSSGLKSYLWSFLPNQIYVGLEPIQWQFFSFGTIQEIIRNLLMLGAAYAIIARKMWSNAQYQLPLVSWGLALVLAYSGYITMPLFNLHFAPSYIFDLYMIPASAFLIGVSLSLIIERLRTSSYLLYAKAVFIILIAINAWIAFDSWETRDSFKVARNGLPPMYISLQSALLKHTGVNDVILSTNELSFMANALSGRKVMVSRRAQNDAFTQDFDERERDAAIILYGNNLAKKRQLLEEYSVDYLYVDAQWSGLEFNGGGPSDPLLVFDSPEKREEFARAGVKVVPLFWYVDPAVRATGVKMYDLLIVSPENYEGTGKGPWQNDLDPLLTPVWSYEENGQTIGILYRVTG